MSSEPTKEQRSRDGYRRDLTPEEIADPKREEWVHALNLKPDALFPNRSVVERGSLFGWRDDRSATGWLSGYVQEIDYTGLRVLVNDIRAGTW